MADHVDPPTIQNKSSVPDDVEVTHVMDAVDPEMRYAKRGRLGAGAMGEVRLCEDRWIGREVALKVALGEIGEESSLGARFLHEAKIQAQLEHPSIVPVYDIGRDRSGAPYFTMKRVRGQTLRRILDELRNGDPAATEKFTRRRLLAAFQSVCLTVDYAHTKGVLHRDLKPANIMLGDFGELYVLDWGVARVGTATATAASAEVIAVPTEREATMPGDVVGTPGYIAPEQLKGEAADGRADVYALGVMLFEILALEPLHKPDASALFTTLSARDARPSLRSPDREIPPELDAICAKATAMIADDRYASARALHDAIDRFLEGDRDLERRRELSEAHVKGAEQLVVSALVATSAGAETETRTEAMAEVNRALAFDPDNTGARRLLVRLLTEPPKQFPQEVQDELDRHHHAQQRRAAWGGMFFYLSFFLWTPVVLIWVDLRHAWFFGVEAIFFAIAAASLYRSARAPFAHRRRTQYLSIVATSFAVCTLSAIAGPLILVPTIALTNAIAYLMQPDRSRRVIVTIMTCLTILVPLALEWVHLVPPSYVVNAGTTIVENRVMDFSTATHAFLVVLTLGLILGAGLYFFRFREMLSDAERRLFLQAWQLRRLVPR